MFKKQQQASGHRPGGFGFQRDVAAAKATPQGGASHVGGRVSGEIRSLLENVVSFRGEGWSPSCPERHASLDSQSSVLILSLPPCPGRCPGGGAKPVQRLGPALEHGLLSCLVHRQGHQSPSWDPSCACPHPLHAAAHLHWQLDQLSRSVSTCVLVLSHREVPTDRLHAPVKRLKPHETRW